jgi:putative transposase
VSRASVYYAPQLPTPEQQQREEQIKSRLDFWHTKQCYMGVRSLRDKLRKEDNIRVGRKLIKRYMDEMGIYAVYPKPNLSKPGKGHKKFPYLLKNKNIFLPNQVWAVDITYIKMGKKHMYLTAIIDWYSRFIVGWALSDTLETAPVLEALKQAMKKYGHPAIINSDQGSQFTSDDYISFLEQNKIRQSMDGKARWIDNVVIERWFRSLKCDCIYINEFDSPRALRIGITKYIHEYNYERPHSAHGGDYPAEVYHLAAAA